MTFADVGCAGSFIAIMGFVIFGIWEMSDSQKSAPVKERHQMVFEAQCDSGTQVFYKPVNTLGIVFDSKGRTVSRMPDCTVVHVGKVQKIGQTP